MLSIGFWAFGWGALLHCLKADSCTSIFAKTVLDGFTMKNQSTKTHLKKSKVD